MDAGIEFSSVNLHKIEKIIAKKMAILKRIMQQLVGGSDASSLGSND